MRLSFPEGKPVLPSTAFVGADTTLPSCPLTIQRPPAGPSLRAPQAHGNPCEQAPQQRVEFAKLKCEALELGKLLWQALRACIRRVRRRLRGRNLGRALEADDDDAGTACVACSGGAIACLPSAVSRARLAVSLRNIASAARRIAYRGSGDVAYNAGPAVSALSRSARAAICVA